MSCEALFLKELHQRGFRLTPQREMVLLVLHRIGHPASAEEIFARVGEKSASVEISTIYRTLDLLSSLNLVSVIDTGDKQRLYELIGAHTPHLHLVCRACGKISGVEQEWLSSFADRLQRELNFTVDLSSLTLSGLCADCQASA